MNNPETSSKALTCANFAQIEPSRELAEELFRKMKECVYSINDSAYKLGRYFRAMYESDMFRMLEDPANTIEEVAHRLHIRRRTMFNVMKVDECLQQRLAYIKNIDTEMILSTPYTKILQINKIILGTKTDGSWEYSDDEIIQWLHTANSLPPEQLAIEIKNKNRQGIRPDPLIMRGKPCAYLHHVAPQKDGSWIIQLRQFYPIPNCSTQAFCGSWKSKKIEPILKEVED